MFLPKATARNPRRRQRTSSDDSVKPPKAKRQRSVLRQAGDSSSAALLRDDSGEITEPVASGLPGDHDLTTDYSGGDSYLPIRGTKPVEESRTDVDGTILLSSTDYYTVEQLPALPDQIRGSQLGTGALKCFFATGHHHALALTTTHAIVWPYSAPTSAPLPSETFTVSIPESCRDPTGAVPLGILLSNATGECPGLLVVIPSTGKLIYWETVSSAASLGLSRQKQNGIQGSVSGLLYGECATEIMSCEPSGVIVTFSSGRVAHITLRDPQGKPSVLVNFLRSTIGVGGGGILGGIKNVLGGGSWRREVAAVQSGGSRQRGQRDVMIATSTGLLEIWDTHWNHGNTLKRKFEVRDDILGAMPPASGELAGESDVKVMDFAFAGQEPLEEPGSPDFNESWRVFMVVSSPQHLGSNTLLVIQLHLTGSKSSVVSTHPVNVHGISDMRSEAKPRILLSRSESTAFILIGQSLVVLSLSDFLRDTPGSQLLLDSSKLSFPFQDIIHLRSGENYEILGYGPEDPLTDEDSASCVMMIRNFGIIRVNTAPFSRNREVEEIQITAKHKLEQAIFFGTMAQNPLNLAGGGGLDFPASEIEQAALEICQELLKSESRFVPSTAISIDQNLRLRAKALSDLATLLLRKGNPLSRGARWELLWGAEKLAAQRAMWRLEETLKEKSDGFLGHVINSMNDKFKTRRNPSQGETDPVHQWFLKDTHQMEHILPWIKNAIKSHWSKSSKQARKLSEQLLEASELFLAITETAYRYRDEHASMYGLADDFLEDGVLADGYEDLPEFWTSRAVGYTETSLLLDWQLDVCLKWSQQETAGADAPDGQVLNKIAENSARHLGVLGLMHSERTRWLAAQRDPKLTDECASLEQTHVKERKWQLFKLAGTYHLEDALALAERFRDMEALVELIIELQDRVKSGRTRDSPQDPSIVDQTEADVDQRISLYFDKFGESWADAYFSRQVSLGNPGALLSMRKYQHAITQFLRKSPAYSKLSWINDVTGEDDYETAAVCLENLALGSEKQLWCHRVEVSLAKLGKLAACERGSSANQFSTQEEIKRLDDFSEIDEIQDTLLVYVKPLLEGAIDQKAEADLALEHFGGHIAEDRPSLHEILGEALAMLVNKSVIGADSLIDLLTLMGPLPPSEEGDGELDGQEFYQALRVLGHSRYVQEDPSYVLALRKLIWRRCMIKDNWEARGKLAERSKAKSDGSTDDTALSHTLRFCLADTNDTGVQSLYQHLAPEAVVMADSEAEILVSRFRLEQRTRVAVDLKREDDLLRHYIDTGKLDFWFQNLVSSIKSEEPSNTGGSPTVDSKARLTWV